MKITIDEMIAKLQEAKQIIGGNKPVELWIRELYGRTILRNSIDGGVTWNDSIAKPIDFHLAGNKSNVQLPIDIS